MGKLAILLKLSLMALGKSFTAETQRPQRAAERSNSPTIFLCAPLPSLRLCGEILTPILLLLILVTACQKPPPKDPCTHFEGCAMTMPYRITIGKQLSKAEQKKVSSLIDKTFAEVHEIFDNWNPDSEISRLNAATAGALVPLSPSLQDLLTLCSKIVALSGGRFDPTIEPLAKVWSEALQQKKMPTPESLQTAGDALGWNHISIHNGIFRKDCSDTRLDLCAVSKGLCIDWIVERLQKMGHEDLFVEWAGEIRAAGHHPENRDWVVQINPALKVQEKSMAPIPLRNQAIAISGDSDQKDWILPAEGSADGQIHRFFHMIDPLTAQPLEKTEHSIAVATVIAPTCALADALATAAMLFPSQKEAESFAQEVVDLYPEVSFWILSYRKK